MRERVIQKMKRERKREREEGRKGDREKERALKAVLMGTCSSCVSQTALSCASSATYRNHVT
jgi:hypothetical protein